MLRKLKQYFFCSSREKVFSLSENSFSSSARYQLTDEFPRRRDWKRKSRPWQSGRREKGKRRKNDFLFLGTRKWKWFFNVARRNSYERRWRSSLASTNLRLIASAFPIVWCANRISWAQICTIKYALEQLIFAKYRSFKRKRASLLSLMLTWRVQNWLKKSI